MPELAEVEYFRRQWDPGIGSPITKVSLHPEKRIFRGTDTDALARIDGSKFESSEAAAKQMIFRFSSGSSESFSWLGIHLGMTGKLSLEPSGHTPGKHDHLVLFQKKHALVFTDARLFGRVLLHQGAEPPDWWTRIPPAIVSDRFTLELMDAFLDRHPKLPVKAALLLQDGFPGIGNWMADEILWRAGIAPARVVANLNKAARKKLWSEARYVSRVALERIGAKYEDVPEGWLFHERWQRAGNCPKHKTPLLKKTIGGRTTAWCPKCQA